MSEALFEIKNLSVEIEGKKVLNELNLRINKGETHALMGRNGSGKTSLAFTIMGHPRYQVTSGDILLEGKSVLKMEPEERAQAGLFLGFQYPVEIPGVTVANFLRSSVRAIRKNELSAKELRARIQEELKTLGIPESFMRRSLNEGFSGGEKKKLETLQLRLLGPKLAVLDETDSGLDIDALKTIATNIEKLRTPDRSFLLITHYQRLLEYIKPDHVHILMNGQIVKSGCDKLAKELESKGYEWVSEELKAKSA